MRKVELLPTRDCEAGYGPDFMSDACINSRRGILLPSCFFELLLQNVVTRPAKPNTFLVCGIFVGLCLCMPFGYAVCMYAGKV